LENFRNGTISLPYTTFSELQSFIKIKNRGFFQESILLKNENWGRKKGGISTYRKHKEIFARGRIIGARSNRKKVTKYHFDLQHPLDLSLSEFIGAFIGDGFTNTYGRSSMIQFAGDKNLDMNYFKRILIPSIKKLSPNSNPILSSKDNTLRLTIYSKELHQLLVRRFRFPAGKKTYSVTIPEEIFTNSNKLLTARCIRGIFDTDGGIIVDKRQIYKKPYLRISLKMESKKLLLQIHSFLNANGLKVNVTTGGRQIQINGAYNCRKYMQLIGFSNTRHSSKIQKMLY